MSGVLAGFRAELARVVTLRPVFSVLVLAVLLYAAFYPQPYLAEALRDVPIALVDQDRTTSSRELARRIDAGESVAIGMTLPDLASAERAVYARRVHGILLIPRDFERDLLHGRASPIALYADASYFLMYQRISGGVSAVARAFGAEVEAARLIGAGAAPGLAVAAADPMPFTAVPLFNPQGGYATYLLPGAFVLIIQQTLLVGVGLLGTLPGGAGARARSGRRPGPVAAVLGKLLAYLAVEAVTVTLYLVVLPYLYGVPRLGSLWAMAAMAVPFVLAVGGLGLVIASLLRRPAAVQVVMAAIGLPFFFLAGFAWPVESMPEAVRLLSALVPSTFAIDGLVRVSQLGASLAETSRQLAGLWTLAVIYAGAAMLLATARPRPAPPAPG